MLYTWRISATADNQWLLEKPTTNRDTKTFASLAKAKASMTRSINSAKSKWDQHGWEYTEVEYSPDGLSASCQARKGDSAMIPITLYMPPELLDKAKAFSEQLDLPLSAMIRDSIVIHMNLNREQSGAS